jgi:hypothetical protein
MESPDPMKRQNTSKWPWMLTAVVTLLSGCTATIIQPDEVIEPAPVYVLDHGRHNSLVLVIAEDDVQRLAFGEWRWYVDGDTGIGRSLSALLVDTPAALGRGRLRGPIDPNCWVHQVGSEIRNVLLFSAERERVSALAEAIDAEFARAEPHYSDLLNLEFVLDARAYSLGHNSNHRVVEWLETLGIEVRGNPTVGLLRPADPDQSRTVDPARCSETN